MATAGRDAPAIAADVLTGARLIASLAFVFLLPARAMTGVAILLSLAWISDFFDGRLARLSTSPTRLGFWDLWADTTIGVGLILGLLVEGTLPLWAGITSLVLFGGLSIAGNVAAMMLLQLTGFVPTLWLLWTDRPALWWLPVATALLIGALDWRRLVFTNIRSFLRGVLGRFEHR